MKKERWVGYRYLRLDNLHNSKVYYCEPSQSVGRTFTTLIRWILKDPELQKIKAYYVVGAENLTLSGKAQFHLDRYKRLYNAGHKTKGPFLRRDPMYLAKRIFRLMMQYKGKHRKLFKKVCFLRSNEVQKYSLVQKGCRPIEPFKLKENLLTRKVKLTDLISKLFQ